MNLEENRDGYMGRSGRRKGKEKMLPINYNFKNKQQQKRGCESEKGTWEVFEKG